MFGYMNSGWNFGGMSQALDDLVSDENCKMETVLDEEELLNELRNPSEALIKFFDKEHISELLDFIIYDPPEGADDKRNFKFPFTAAEVFTCDVKEIIDLFFTAQGLKDKAESCDEDPLIQKYKDEPEDSENVIGENDVGKEESASLIPNKIQDIEAEGKQKDIQVPVVEEKSAEDEIAEKTSEKSGEALENHAEVLPKKQEDIASSTVETVTEVKPEKVEEAASAQPSEKSEPEIKEKVEEKKGSEIEEKSSEKTLETQVVAAEKEEKVELVEPASVKITPEEKNEIKALGEESVPIDIVPQPDSPDVGSEEDEVVIEEQPIPKYDLLEKLLSFLKNEGELNAILAGYFAKAVSSLLDRRKQDFLDY